MVTPFSGPSSTNDTNAAATATTETPTGDGVGGGDRGGGGTVEEPTTTPSSSSLPPTAVTAAVTKEQQQQQQEDSFETTATTTPETGGEEQKSTLTTSDIDGKGNGGHEDDTKMAKASAAAEKTVKMDLSAVPSDTATVPVVAAQRRLSSGSGGGSQSHSHSNHNNKTFVRKTKRRVIDDGDKSKSGVLDALVIDSSTKSRSSSRTWKVRLVVNDCQFPSGKPVEAMRQFQHLQQQTSTSLTGSRVRSATAAGSSFQSQKQQQSEKKQAGSRGGGKKLLPSRRTRSNSNDALSILDDRVDTDDEDTTGTKRTTRRQQQQQQQQDAPAADAAAIVPPPVPILEHQISQDGNYHYCRICQLTGEVVCCDGCPQVYHRSCMPDDEPARVILDVQGPDDQWFCPDCRATHEGRPSPKWQKAAAAAAAKANEAAIRLPIAGSVALGEDGVADAAGGAAAAAASTSRGRSVGGRGSGGRRGGLPFAQSKTATAASSPTPGGSSTAKRKSPMRDAKKNAPEIAPEIDDEETEDEMTDVEDNNSAHESPDSENGSVAPTTLPPSKGATAFLPSRRRGRRNASKEDKISSGGPVPRLERKKRNRARSQSEDTVDGGGADPSGKRGGVTSLWTKDQAQQHHDQTMKRKKKKQRVDPTNPTSGAGSANTASSTSDEQSKLAHEENIGGAPKATPAFFFFMNENRSKIERSLARKHRSFQRLPKGMERNALVTKEAAAWWTKLDEPEIKRYMDMSMRQYEQRIIEWKEEKTIREMTEITEGDPAVASGSKTDVVTMNKSGEGDEKLTYDKYQRLYRSTNCGYKQFKPDSDGSHNRILLELLQDMRFHPHPMIQAQRGSRDYGQMDFDRMTVPYFDVQGPVSTSLGDECLGCSRGWTHFCHVLKRKVPSAEHRAKLQPPLSSLMATRVGLGLKNHMPSNHADLNEDIESSGFELFTKRDLPETKEAKLLPSPRWESLSSPTDRADDVVNFIEEIAHMKVPDPPTPSLPETSQQQERKKKKNQRRVSLPLGRRRAPSAADVVDAENDAERKTAYKCGRCRNIIEGVTGCIPCRRAQLVINLAKGGEGETAVVGTTNGEGHDAESASLKVRAHMLGRVSAKDATIDEQTEGDAAVANHILRQRWAPFTIMPPTVLPSPVRKSCKRQREEIEQSNQRNTVSNSKDNEESDNEEDLNVRSSSATTSRRSGTAGVSMGDVSDSGGSSRSSPTSDILSQSADLSSKFEPADKGDNGSQRKRTRGKTVGLGTGRSSPSFEFSDRPQLSQELQEKKKELNKQMVPVACYGIYLAMIRRDPLLLFADAAKEIEGYNTIIKNPMDFRQIRENLLSGSYTSVGAFVADARLLCLNALYFNDAGTIYAKTAQELLDLLTAMHKRATKWMTTLKDALALALRQAYKADSPTMFDDALKSRDNKMLSLTELLSELRQESPKAVEMLECEESLRQEVQLDFRRTRENEIAYYGAIAIQRAAIAAAASLAPYPDSGGTFNPVSKRSYLEDEKLRRMVREKVAETAFQPQLKHVPTWREDSVIRILRKAQNRRLEGMSEALDGCARVDGADGTDRPHKIAMSAEALGVGRRRKPTDHDRVDKSRKSLTTGVGSKMLRELVEKRREDFYNQQDNRGIPAVSSDQVDDAAVTVRGSRVHGWGLFADQPFKKGDFVAEYIGEYVSPAVTDARETMYQQQRIQDYQFRLDHTLVIDATMRGGHGRYINHSCSPNCNAKVVPGDPPNQHLKRVIIVADRDIAPLEELSYDYQFPLEEDLSARIPCNCQSESCRGFMNWDLPEKGSSFQDFRSQKRGANMRDRIRRLGRPLKAK